MLLSFPISQASFSNRRRRSKQKRKDAFDPALPLSHVLLYRCLQYPSRVCRLSDERDRIRDPMLARHMTSRYAKGKAPVELSYVDFFFFSSFLLLLFSLFSSFFFSFSNIKLLSRRLRRPPPTVSRSYVVPPRQCLGRRCPRDGKPSPPECSRLCYRSSDVGQSVNSLIGPPRSSQAQIAFLCSFCSRCLLFMLCPHAPLVYTSIVFASDGEIMRQR